MIRVGLLTSRTAESSVPVRSLRGAAEHALSLRGAPGMVVKVSADRLRAVPDVDLLVNLLGPLYPEEGWQYLVDYFRLGGVILSVAPAAFTVPYRFEDESPVRLPPTDRALHSLGFIDTLSATGDALRPARVRATPRFEFLERLADRGEFPTLLDLRSFDVRVALRPARPEDLYSSRGLTEARFEPSCLLLDEDGRPVHCPVARLDLFGGGSLVFLNGTPADPGYFDTDPGREFLSGLLRASLGDSYLPALEAGFARYYPGETATLGWQFRRLGPKKSRHPHKGSHRSIRIDLFRVPGFEHPVATRTVRLRERGSAAGAVRFRDLPEGRYSASVTVLEDGESAAREWTGFYVFSDRAVRREVRKFPPITLDPARTPDYLIREGRPMPMHGTTYMVRGRYRDCFQNVNVHVCDEDMARLAAAGINVLRTGVWTGYEGVYRPSGEFREAALRSLDAYFLTAARHGLPVQFAFAAFVMNHWDRTRNPIHDPAMLRRIHRMFHQFMGRYAGWPNVQVDVINEPSYSPYRDGFMWKIARPFGDLHERRAWVRWLRGRYGDIRALREAWGVTAAGLARFEDAQIPELQDFTTNYDGPPGYDARARIIDFMDFARESFSEWVAGIRDIVRKEDSRMLVMVGRDETIRVPTQQDDAFRGNIDLVNWHQWHREGLMFVEYVLNRTRGMPCCGQEMGILPYKDQRSGERLNEKDRLRLLERKLLYCLGNWIQWQSHNDVSMDNVKETKLGLIRADGTEKPGMASVRLLSWLEDRMAARLTGRRENREDIVVIHPSTLHFSSDHPLAYRAAMQSIIALHYHLGRQAVLVLEHLFRPGNRAQIGEPGLIVFPSPTILREETWEHLLSLVREKGKTAVVSGQVDVDEHWRFVDRLSAAGIRSEPEKAATREPLRIGGRDYHLSFRDAVKLALPGKVLGKPRIAGESRARVIVRGVGKGTLVYSPLPVELADSIDPTVALYRVALGIAPIGEAPYHVRERDHSPAHLIYPVRYRRCTAYTLVNEGPDDVLRFRDGVSGVWIAVEVSKERGAKIYLSREGVLLGAYVHGRLEVGDDRFEVSSTTAFARKGSGYEQAPFGPAPEKKTARRVRAVARGIEQ